MAKKQKVESLRHQAKRKNIPTEELRDFVAEDEATPKTMLYPRDPSLDPQLVWQGKDEQDREDLAVPVVPIYIQEKIQPQAIVEEVRRHAEENATVGNAGPNGAVMEQTDLMDQFFSDFNGLPEEFEHRVDFYKHEGHWQNRMILGDSLMVMTSLAEKEGLKGQVQAIYLDPPYGIKFGSNWQVSTRKRDVKDGKAEDATRQPEQVRAFRDTWKLGIHSYLAYLRDRLVAARELLTETGSVFVQIGDENVHLVRCLMDEVFGSQNFVCMITVKKTAVQTDLALSSVADYILWFCKSSESIKYREPYVSKEVGDAGSEQYRWVRHDDGRFIRVQDQAAHPANALCRPDNLTSSHEYSLGKEAIEYEGKFYRPGGRYWSTSPASICRLGRSGRLHAGGKTLSYARFLCDFFVMPLLNVWTDTGTGGYGDDRFYVVQTTAKVIQRCLLMTTDPGDLVLDPTCGSGTTAYVAEQWGRRWITCDTSRVALALARTRLMSARYPYYHLAEDYPEALRFGADDNGLKKYLRDTEPAVSGRAGQADVRQGFVYRRVPHITLKSIANNAEIDAIWEKWQAKQEPLREKLNAALKKKWQEWEIPREAAKDWPKEVAQAHGDWWKARIARQREIDASIARNADFETLYDQPYEDSKSVRVCGPFTVESLSPHRVLPAADENLDGAVTTGENAQRGDFARMILDNLKKAGVQNTIKNERLKFDTLDTYPGQWIQAEGTYTDGEKKTRRVAVAIGPEHGTVGPVQVKEAAKEAVQGVGFDLLVVCGFAFDPHVSEETKRYGKLQVLPTRMNPDLAMGDELLKKTGAGNLFMVFGEPDVEVVERKDGRMTVRLLGVDVYDPTTGQIRSNSTDDIACWFLDTNYDGESFFVRHAYFTGAEEPYDKLKRALRAEIDEDAWATLYRTESRPFDKPTTGKIAVKVINHYGDEVLKVFGG